MDLANGLAFTVRLLAALLVFYILLLIILGWRRDNRPGPMPLARRAKCPGVRNGGACGKPVYLCSNCKESGCQLKGCSNRRFEPPGKCLSCGYPNTMQ